MCSLRLIPKENCLIRDSFEDFILAKRAALLSPDSIAYYRYTAGFFVKFLIEENLLEPNEITSRIIREYLSQTASRELSDHTILAHARGIRAFVNFLHEEDYLEKPIKVKMPKVREKEVRVLSPEEMETLLKTCDDIRDKALLLFMLDTGLRRSEVIYLNWGDIDLDSGLVIVKKTKNKKTRSVFVGYKTRRALLKYRRKVRHENNSPLFCTASGDRFKPNGLSEALRRLRRKTGIPFSAHDLRRTFATLSLRAGMNVFHLQSLLGHSSLEMTRKYLKLVTEDLQEAHTNYAPVDKFL